MKRTPAIVGLIVITLCSIVMVGVLSWNRSNGVLPPEILELVKDAKDRQYIDFSTGDEGWLRHHEFIMRTGKQQFAHKAKQTLTKDKGWTVVFPDLKFGPYCFEAEKRDARGKLICSATFNAYGDDRDVSLYVKDPRHSFPWWRAWFAEKKAQREVQEDTATYY